VKRLVFVLIFALFLTAFCVGFFAEGSPRRYAYERVCIDYGTEACRAQERYGYKATKLFLIFGATPEFQDVQWRFGYQQTIPIIYYFLEHESLTFKVHDKIARGAKEIQGSFGTGKIPAFDSLKHELTPVERAWIAILEIQEEGNDFLGCFAINHEGEVARVLVSRVFALMKKFFVGGLDTLERRYRLGKEMSTEDLTWAGVDVVALGLVGAKSASLLARGARAGKRLKRVSFASRAMRAAPRAFRSSRLAKFGLIGLGGYLVWQRPSAFNAALGALAVMLGWHPLALQSLGWFLVIAVPLYFLSWIFLPVWWVVRPIVRQMTV